MGYRRHNILKCHTCKSRHPIGGSKKAGRDDGAVQSGWVLRKNEAGAWVRLCPACARKPRPTQDRPLPASKSDRGTTPARAGPGARKR